MEALVVNGPNLNLLGRRNPEVYGETTLAGLENAVVSWGGTTGFGVSCYQSNHEGAIVDRIHDLIDTGSVLVINPGALTHYSYALRDAIEGVGVPAVEVHISNIRDREQWRNHSVIEDVCDTSILGRGTTGYRWALEFLARRRESPARVEDYGSHPRQRVSIRSGTGTPLAVVHTGVDDHTTAWDQVETIATSLGGAGHPVVSIEYRPGHADADVAAALAHTGHQGRVILDGDAATLAGGLDHDITLLDPLTQPGDGAEVIISGGDVSSRIFSDRSWLDHLSNL